jgi:hypothetical protein
MFQIFYENEAGGVSGSSSPPPIFDPTASVKVSDISQQIDDAKIVDSSGSAVYTQQTETSKEIVDLVNNLKLLINMNSDRLLSPNNRNPYLANISFAAVMSQIMNEISSLNTNIGFLEAQTELKLRAMNLDMAKANATATKASYDAQAAEQYNNAIASFVNAAMSGMQAMFLMYNSGKAQNEYKKQEKDLIAKDKLANPDRVGIDGELNKGFVPTEKGAAATKELADFQKNKANFISTTSQHYDQITKSMFDMVSQSVNGWKEMSNSALKGLEGSLQALILTIQGEQKALDSYSSHVSESEKKAHEAVTAAQNFRDKILDALLKYSSI